MIGGVNFGRRSPASGGQFSTPKHRSENWSVRTDATFCICSQNQTDSRRIKHYFSAYAPPPAPPDQNTTTSGATAPKMPRMMPIAPSTQANRSSIFADVITDAVDSTMPSSSAAAALS